MRIIKPLLVLSLLLSTCFSLTAQEIIPGKDTVYSLADVDVKPVYPGGEKARIDFIEKKVNGFVPLDNGAPRGTYTVVIICIIDTDGKIISTLPETSLGYGMEQEVIRIIKKLPKPYIPAMKNGVAVKSKIKFPVTFAF